MRSRGCCNGATLVVGKCRSGPMRRRTRFPEVRRNAATALVVAALVAVAAGPAPAATPKACRAAVALARLGHSEDARAAYLEVLKTNRASPCAQNGLLRLARMEFWTAGALLHAG